MAHKVDNAVILAAGLSSRFAPLSYEKPKGLLKVRGEVLIERQIRQLQEAGVKDIFVVTGYKAEAFSYLQDLSGVKLLHNPDYAIRNNHSSIWVARNVLANTYICSVDNYFAENPYEAVVSDPYYACLYAKGPTKEWCVWTDEAGYINKVEIGGADAYYMMGHVFWDQTFSRDFLHILEPIHALPETRDALWERIYLNHLDQLKLKVRPYGDDEIFEFDSLEELRAFDPTYLDHSGSEILDRISREAGAKERDITNIVPDSDGFTFRLNGRDRTYRYDYQNQNWRTLS
jgi:CTP:phosphocholine cytidylyltransferase-like protein